jgi:hypothetical protein
MKIQIIFNSVVVKLTNQIMQHYKTPEVLVINCKGATQVPLEENLKLKSECGGGEPGPTCCWYRLT